jgi:peptidoglycan-N-acetylglucosamine deacetylase
MGVGVGVGVGVSLTFDVDGEAAVLEQGVEYSARLSSLSEARYGVVRGLPRIVALLEHRGIAATFYVPGATAQRHPEAIAELAAAGHEVAHHGYLHRRSDHLDTAGQREEIERGIDALRECVGERPVGYRSPSWELTPETLALLIEHEFLYDSSCMGDDRPYWERHGDHALLELPVHWSLDDFPYFAFSADSGGHLAGTSGLLACWQAEFDAALIERRHVTYTMHPEIIGRAHRLPVLEQLLDHITERAVAWFATHRQLAEYVHSNHDASAARHMTAQDDL